MAEKSCKLTTKGHEKIYDVLMKYRKSRDKQTWKRVAELLNLDRSTINKLTKGGNHTFLEKSLTDLCNNLGFYDIKLELEKGIDYTSATLKASQQGISIVKSTLKLTEAALENKLVDLTHLTSRLIKEFLNGNLIPNKEFKLICSKVKLDWKDIVEISTEEQSGRSARNDSITPNINECLEQLNQYLQPERARSNGRNMTKYILILTAVIDSLSPKDVEEFGRILQNIGRTLSLIKLDEGSIKLTVEGSPEDIERLVSMIELGELKELNGFPIKKDIQTLSESLDDEETVEAKNKWSLIEKILSAPARARNLENVDLSNANLSGVDLIITNLSGADLSGADLINTNLSDADLSGANLSDADLSGANLSGANLNGANVKDAQFGAGTGLSEDTRLDLKRRGAIFVFSTQPSKKLVELRLWLRHIVGLGQNLVEDGWQTFEDIFASPEPIPFRSPKGSEHTSPDAIASVIRLLQPNQPEQIRCEAAGVLGEIGAGNSDVINALTELLHSAKEEDTRWRAAISLGKVDPENPQAAISKVRIIDLGMQLGDIVVALVVTIMPKANGRIGVFLQVKPPNETTLPSNLKLSLLSESGETLREVEARSDLSGRGKDKSIELRFFPPPETFFRVRVTRDNVSVTQNFVA